ncbi:MAG: N-acetylmuramoyl-L-alanine amidase [Actinomycetales bacterium]|nr:N-acetylmuramoyl-L-alanine amidase [Actinomycetales bacterium]
MPASGFVPVKPETQIQEFTTKTISVMPTKNAFVQTVLSKSKLEPFSLVGVIWSKRQFQDIQLASSQIEVKVLEAGIWSDWYPLNFDADHAPDQIEAVKHDTTQGTDPLITGISTGLIVRVKTKSAKSFPPVKVSLVYSAPTTQDQRVALAARRNQSSRRNLNSITTKSGAVVARPNIVSRAEWGADESLRDPSPRIGEKIIAGFLHHTATTNSYQPEDGPAQMRDLYAYFINVRKYSDIAYNFLVDRYGVIYEGRAGCSLNPPTPCDGPSRPVIGGHTAGMNRNTFAVSVLGNFETTKPDSATAEKIVSSVSALIAWKLAPYDLYPSTITKIKSTDTAGLSKFPNGAVASIPVISAHRDVGKTVCPGKYFYPYLPEIRSRITGLLVGKIEDLSVGPTLQQVSDREPITVRARIPISANWNVTILSATTGQTVFSKSGEQRKSANFVLNWDYSGLDNQTLPIGDYAISLSATIGQQQLPTEVTMVTLGDVPTKITGLKLKRIAKNSAMISWPAQAPAIPQIDQIQYRMSTSNGKNWTDWKTLPVDATSQVISTSRRKTKVFIEFRSSNLFGLSESSTVSFISKS